MLTTEPKPLAASSIIQLSADQVNVKLIDAPKQTTSGFVDGLHCAKELRTSQFRFLLSLAKRSSGGVEQFNRLTVITGRHGLHRGIAGDVGDDETLCPLK